MASSLRGFGVAFRTSPQGKVSFLHHDQPQFADTLQIFQRELAECEAIAIKASDLQRHSSKSEKKITHHYCSQKARLDLT
jgi:hypothetical protein